MCKILKFNLAREALGYIVKLYNIKKLHIPYYLCDVVRHKLVELSCKPLFYHINNNFYPDCEFDKDDFILYPNYWGICSKNVRKLVNKYPKLIVDNAHAYFDKPLGFASFNAGHKFGFKNSYAFLGSNDIEELQLNFYTEVIQKRKSEFLRIHDKYKNINLLNIDLTSTPFCYPCLVDTIESADKLVEELKQEGKTVYRYWNNIPESFNEYKFYSRLVPIPIELN